VDLEGFETRGSRRVRDWSHRAKQGAAGRQAGRQARGVEVAGRAGRALGNECRHRSTATHKGTGIRARANGAGGSVS